MNVLHIIGNLTRDPETRTTQNGGTVCTFTVAVNRHMKGNTQEADFFRVSAWGQLGENCQKFLAKGRKVAVTGSVSVNAYTTQNGENRASLEAFARDVEFLTPRAEQGAEAHQSANTGAYEQDAGYAEVDADDLPF